MTPELRETGIAAIGEMPWGTHFCHFYQTPHDLLDTVIPYLRTGLANREQCLWVTRGPLNQATRDMLRRAIPDVDRHVTAGDIRILPYSEWYLDKDGVFDAPRVIAAWDVALAQALDKGYDGLRAAADEAWLGTKYWQAFADYENELDEPISRARMIVMCAYPLECQAGAIFDVARTHQFATAERHGKWQTLETPELKHAKAELKRLNEELEQRVVERTQELAESHQLLQAIIDNTTAVIYVKDLHGRFLLTNRRFEALFHVSRESAVGKTDLELFLPEQAEAFRAFDRQVLLAGTALEAEEVVSQDDGLHTYISIKCPLYDSAGQPFAICGISTDISERKRAEAERQAREAAESASRAKSQFVAHMSHELRSPLNTILGFAHLLSRDKLPVQAKRDLNTILHSGEHLLTLINHVLDLSKIEAGRAELEETHFGLPDLLDELQQMFALRAEERGIELNVERGDVPCWIRADQTKLRQVLINLLGNAVKFTRAGRVTVAVHGGSSPGRLAFAVADTGPGIAPGELQQLFAPFVQAEAGRRAAEGSGLGLAISRSFVRLMGGELQIDSRPGQGATARFEIPVEVVSQQPSVPANESANASAKPRGRVVALAPGQPRRRLLIVDDRAEARELLVRLLEPLGFELAQAIDGQSAVDFCRSSPPDLVWMDLRMPGLDGLEATRRIKAATADGERAPVIIALTASAYEEKRDEILAAGCDDFQPKPFREDDVFGLLERHLNVRFVRDADQAALGTPRPEATQLAALPAALRAQLAQALVQLDPEGIEDAIDAICQCDTSTAQSLATLAAEFQYDLMLKLVQDASRC